MGKRIAPWCRAQVRMLPEGEFNAYVNSLVQLLAVNSDATVPLTLAVIDSDEVESVGPAKNP